MDIKTEADGNDIAECPHDDRPTTGMSVLVWSFDCVFMYCN